MKEKKFVDVLYNAASKLNLDVSTLRIDLEGAKKDHPKLSSAFAILALYTQHLEAEHRIAFRTGSVGTLQYIPGFQREVDWFAVLAEGAMEEFLAGDTEGYPTVRVCSIIKQDYNAAVKNVRRFMDQLPETDAEWNHYHNYIDALKLHAAEMEAKGCKLS